MNKVVQGEEMLRIEIGCLVIFRPCWLVIVVSTVCVVKYLSRFSFFYDVYIHQKSCAPSVGWRKTWDTDNQQLSSLPRFTQLQLNLFLVPFFLWSHFEFASFFLAACMKWPNPSLLQISLPKNFENKKKKVQKATVSSNLWRRVWQGHLIDSCKQLLWYTKYSRTPYSSLMDFTHNTQQQISKSTKKFLTPSPTKHDAMWENSLRGNKVVLLVFIPPCTTSTDHGGFTFFFFRSVFFFWLRWVS